MLFFPGDKPTLCFSNITLVAICAFDFMHCALAMFGVNHVLVGRKQITNLLGGLKTVLIPWDFSTNFIDSDNLGIYGKVAKPRTFV